MARLRPANKIAVDVPVAAMSDVAFLLIIFFIVTTSFKRASHLPVELPGEQTTAEASPDKNVNPRIKVGTDRTWLNDSPTEIYQLSGDLQSVLYGKARPEERVVVLTADDGVPMERVVEVMDVIRAADAHVGYLHLEEQ